MRAHRRRHIAHGRHILGDILGDDDDAEGEVTDTDACRPLLSDSFANVDADLLALVVEAQHGSDAQDAQAAEMRADMEAHTERPGAVG